MRAARVVFLSLTGCSGMFNIENGYAHAIAKSPEQAAGYISFLLGFGGVGFGR